MIDTPEKLFKYMKENFKFGFYSSLDNKIHIRNKLDKINNIEKDYEYKKLLFSSYELQSFYKLLDTKCGTCFDQVMFARKWFIDHNYKIYLYYCTFHNHVFLVYKDNNKYCYFDTTLDKVTKIVKKNSLNEIKKYYKKIQPFNSNIEFKLYRFYSLKENTSFYDIIYKITKDKDFVIKERNEINKELKELEEKIKLS